MTTRMTNEGFIVFEVDGNIPTLRAWILRSDVDASIFAQEMRNNKPLKAIGLNYLIRRADVTEFNTKY